MTRRTWVRLDNASNIFLAARSSADPKVFRISAEMNHSVDPQRLQQALDETYDRYPLYRAVLRRGIFWYYLQDSDLHPIVTSEDQHTCAPLYWPDRRNLLFRVVHHRRRIILELSHVLSDGTGALWFLSDLVTAYVRLQLQQQDECQDDTTMTEPIPDHGRAHAPAPGDDSAHPAHDLVSDSFVDYFRRRRPRTVPTSDPDFSRAAVPAVLTVENPAQSSRTAPLDRGRPRPPRTKVHRVRGTRTSDLRTRVVELTVPTTQMLTLARAERVALTMYLTGLFFEAIRRSSNGLGKSRTLAASVPVNLRQFFPSTSPRNFFATIRVEHTYGRGADDLGSICRGLDRQFRPKASRAALEKKLQRFLRLERLALLRILPRPLKDVILNLVNRSNNRGLTVAVSNLGRMNVPEPIDSHLGRMLFHVSAVRPQLSALSHGDLLTLSFTSPFTETGHIREYARLLTSTGVAVTVAAARVTETELEEAHLEESKMIDRAAELTEKDR